MAEERPDHERRPFPEFPEVHLPRVQVPEGLVAGQTALVTGGSRGIGKACALALARAGADVAVGYHSKQDEAGAVAEEVRKLGRKSIAIGGDVSVEADVLELFRRARKELGPPDIAVINAGWEKQQAIEEITAEDWNSVIGVNLTGAFLCAREAVKEFKARGVAAEKSAAAGKIIFISSVHDVIPWKGFTSYVASKGGVSMMMKSMALELARERIRVNAVSPGATRTDINEDAWKEPEKYRELLTKIPYNRVGETDDVARAVVWLASDQSDYVTGTTLYVDGGMTLYPSFESGG